MKIANHVQSILGTLFIELERLAFKFQIAHYKHKMLADFQMIGAEPDVYPINVQS